MTSVKSLQELPGSHQFQRHTACEKGAVPWLSMNFPMEKKMIKKLGIAAACGIAVYGIAKLIKRHLVVAPNRSAEFLSHTAAGTGPGGENAHERSGASGITGVAAIGQALGESPDDDATAAIREDLVKEQQNGSIEDAPCL